MIAIEQTLGGILVLSFGLGMLHAFDADHIVAVSSLSSRSSASKKSFTYALKWAFGHGGILLLIAVAAYFFRLQLPDIVLWSAEKMVGIILIIAGLSVLWSFQNKRIRFNIHHHGNVVHGHLASDENNANHDHTPVLVGVVHGLAGSAPALALIPATLYQPAIALGYVLIFSLGVLVGMSTFGLLLSHGQRFLNTYSPAVLNSCRIIIGLGATGLGCYWLGAN